MKKYMISLFVLFLFFSFESCRSISTSQHHSGLVVTEAAVTPRQAGQTHVLKLAADPIPVVRIAFIGVGNRGESAVHRYTFMEGVEIKACVTGREGPALPAAPAEQKIFPGRKPMWGRMPGKRCANATTSIWFIYAPTG